MKNHFSGLDIEANWPPLPQGRLISESNRHLTLLFLGERGLESLDLTTLPTPPKLGLPATFDQCLFLGSAVAWHVKTENDILATYANQLASWLNIDERRPFLPHVSLARKPFDKQEWLDHFIPKQSEELGIARSPASSNPSTSTNPKGIKPTKSSGHIYPSRQ